MKIEIAKAENLQDIITINKFVDYQNPDEFFKEQYNENDILVI